jgi:hypothetical protein
MSCCCEKPVAEARDNSGTQRKGNVHHTEQWLVKTLLWTLVCVGNSEL